MLPAIRKGTGLMNRGRNRLSGLFNDDLFESFFSDFDNIFDNVKYTDKEGNLVYEIEVPGFNKECLSVEIADGILTVSGERKVNEDYVGQRKIYKRMTVAKNEDVDAEIKDGILYLKFKQPTQEKVKIEVK